MLRIVTWHRIGDPERSYPMDPATGLGSDPALFSATPEDFRNQVEFLASRFHVVSPAEVMEAVEGAAELPGDSVLLTFDDAYRDFADVAWPILRRVGVPAVVFVSTAHADQPERRFWWDRLYGAVMTTQRPSVNRPEVGTLSLRSIVERRAALVELKAAVKRLPHCQATALVDAVCDALGEPEWTGRATLGWEELRRLSREGAWVGAHSRTHPVLPSMTRGMMSEEIQQSVEDVRREVDPDVVVFSYPYGAHDDHVVAAVREAGVRLAVTTLDGHNDLESVDPLRLHRTNVTSRTSPLLLRVRLQPWSVPFDRWRHRHEREVWHG